ncbi:SRPBCC family protein [Neobacillus sp. MM2021_6]|uniref:CoxG family protein n=1 Tax=Bacillaceae TaxID=186817 RepID=UPI00140DE9A2|nr:MULTISPECIES: SRPBCC family protein [Bacillaceae]MBO0960422.1 SRPBCC family protein [Neobacillus sp. MM2021_6]NHC16721.1 SRPBCC family protein [Bacillus sp. MM2020_4]
MPSELQQVELDIPIEVIWDFIRDENNWAPLVPGYIQHEKMNERQISWEFKSDLVVMKKKVTLVIDIKEWNEPSKVSFELKRKNEKYIGEGYFEAKAINRNKTRITGFLEINATGPMGTLANNLFKKAIQITDEEVTVAISSKLEEFTRK